VGAREFYERFAALLEATVLPAMTLRRARLRDDWASDLPRLARALTVRRDVREMRAIRDAADTIKSESRAWQTPENHAASHNITVHVLEERGDVWLFRRFSRCLLSIGIPTRRTRPPISCMARST
jgi:hypothetical protein